MNTFVIYGALALTGVALVMYLFKGGKKKPELSSQNLAFQKIEASSPRLPQSSSVKKAVKRDDQISVRVFFGSQTGTAEDFAGTLVKEAKTFDAFFPILTPMDDYNFDELQNEKLVIFCVATYGEGEPTDNAKDFYEWLMDGTRGNDCDLSSVRFTVFGLGNKTYEHFNHIARKVDTRLEELGGKRIYEKGEGDDDASLQEDFENWKSSLWESVCREFNVSANQVSKVQNPTYQIKSHDSNTALSTRITWNKQKYDERIFDVKNPKFCKITRKIELHSPKSDRSCIHVEIELPQGFHYSPGDHLGIFAWNDYDEVSKLAKRLNSNLNDVISLYHPNQAQPIVGPTTVEKLLSCFVDIVSPPKPEILKVLSDLYTADPNEKERLNYLSSMGPGREEYNKWVKNPQRTLFEILEEFPSCNPALHHVVELLPNMLPRFYSISSSIKENPNSVHATAVVVKYRTETGRLHKGICTTWLDSRNIGDEIPIFIRTSTFRLPRNPKAPIIMIGPGTGIAPFRGFLQERRHLNPDVRGECILFFGCRARDLDFLYEEELTRHLEDGSLTKLITAFSREQEQKVYVQDKIKEFSDEIWALLQNPLCHVYVCGDAKAMAKDVHKALKQVVIDSGKKSPQEAESFITNLQKAAPTSRYQQDVWT